jgi:hypothetical protein
MFYAGALRRISRAMIGLTAVFTIASLLFFNWHISLGFLCGCAVSYLNFYWLEQGVKAFAERVAEAGSGQSSRGIVLRFLVRYALMAAAAYVIFTLSPASVYGLFAGLFLPVAAIACEAAYEAYAALARGV